MIGCVAWDGVCVVHCLSVCVCADFKLNHTVLSCECVRERIIVFVFVFGTKTRLFFCGSVGFILGHGVSVCACVKDTEGE